MDFKRKMVVLIYFRYLALYVSIFDEIDIVDTCMIFLSNSKIICRRWSLLLDPNMWYFGYYRVYHCTVDIFISKIWIFWVDFFYSGIHRNCHRALVSIQPGYTTLKNQFIYKNLESINIINKKCTKIAKNWKCEG